MTQSQIARIPPGDINEVNDPIIGGQPVGMDGTGGVAVAGALSRTAGQLGKWADLDIDMLRYNPGLGTLFGGEYQYVQLDPAADDSPPIAVGTLLYFLAGADPDEFIVSETVNANNEAGYVVSAVWTAGYYAWIYRFGQPADRTPLPAV